jgi:threonine/homoserine/homoserine lactone efflux protein
MSPELYAAFFLACFVLVILPGLLNVAGNQLGLAVIVSVVAAGLASLVAALGGWFEWVRLAGAAYLVWLGWRMLRSTGQLAAGGPAPRPRGGFFLQGFLVSISNPKTLFFVGAFFPQFVDATRPYLLQLLLMGVTFMAIAAVCDGAYAVLSGRAGRWISLRRVRAVSRLSGAFLIAGGAWLAFSRSR